MEKNNTEHLFDKYYGPSGYGDNTPEEEIYVTDREEEALSGPLCSGDFLPFELDWRQ
jgi:hypothetical protein